MDYGPLSLPQDIAQDPECPNQHSNYAHEFRELERIKIPFTTVNHRLVFLQVLPVCIEGTLQLMSDLSGNHPDQLGYNCICKCSFDLSSSFIKIQTFHIWL